MTEISPSAANSRTIVPKPSKMPLAAASIDVTVSKSLPAGGGEQRAEAHQPDARRGAEPQYVHQNVLRTVTSGGR